MAYGGGKGRIGKQIAKVIQDYIDDNEYDSKGYFEPFCGMLGVAHNMNSENFKKIILSDINKDIVLMWKALKRNWKPPKNCTKELHTKMKNTKRHSALRGYVGVGCSYSGIFFAGYRPIYKDQKYLDIFKRKIDKIKPFIKQKNVKFLDGDYKKVYKKIKPKGYVIYCDPPYLNNNFKTEFFDNFDHDEFWETMRKWSKHNLVFISEYKAPKDFKAIWKKDIKMVHSGNTRKKTEKLFVYKN